VVKFYIYFLYSIYDYNITLYLTGVGFLLHSAASIAAIVSAIIAIFAFRPDFREEGIKIVSKILIKISGHSSLKKFFDAIVSRHPVLSLFTPIFFVIGFQIIPILGVILLLIIIIKSTPSIFFYNIVGILLVTFSGLFGAYVSGILDLEIIYKGGFERLDIYFLLYHES